MELSEIHTLLWLTQDSPTPAQNILGQAPPTPQAQNLTHILSSRGVVKDPILEHKVPLSQRGRTRQAARNIEGGEKANTHTFFFSFPHRNTRAVQQPPSCSSSLALPPYLVPALKRPLPLLEQVSFLSFRHDVFCFQPAPRLLHHLPQLGGLRSRVKGEQQLVSSLPQSMPQGPELGPPSTTLLLRPAGYCRALKTEYSQPGRECPFPGSP